MTNDPYKNYKNKLINRLKDISESEAFLDGDKNLTSEAIQLTCKIASLNQMDLEDLEEEMDSLHKQVRESGEKVSEIAAENKLLKTFIDFNGLNLKYQWFALKMTK
ncbi:hypothetical protein [Priestia flexa]|uniref:hypothetical protein n=1 Tax=Priestia flexa TaxID=86664 RepID=UPI003CFD6007